MAMARYFLYMVMMCVCVWGLLKFNKFNPANFTKKKLLLFMKSVT